jgi:hypothetical protein
MCTVTVPITFVVSNALGSYKLMLSPSFSYISKKKYSCI